MSTQGTNQLLPVGVDDGHKAIKVCYGYDPEKKEYKLGHFQSEAVEGLAKLASFGGASAPAFETNNKKFTISDGRAMVVSMDTRRMDYPVSDLNRVLVHHALAECGLGGEQLYLITGLPVDQYYLHDGQPNVELIERKMESLRIPVARVGQGKPLAKIVRQSVASEAIAAFYDALLTPTGGVNAEIQALIKRKPIAVVDPGGKTSDIVCVTENASGIYTEQSGTENIGVIKHIHQFTAVLKSQFGLNDAPSFASAEEALRTKKFDYFGETKDVTKLVEAAVHPYMEQVKDFFQKKLGDGHGLGGVIFVGGGSALIRSTFGDEAFKEIFRGKRFIAENPTHANAIGKWKRASFIVRPEDRIAPVENTDAVGERA